ncbi:MAG: class I SAM-dependent methyltransferase [Promethearchaeota archaeon]
MNIIKPQEFIHFIPKEYQRYAGIGPYLIPIFGKMYFERIRYILSKILKSAIKPFKVLDVGAGFGFFSVNFKLNFPKCNYYLLDLYSNELLDIVKSIMYNKLNLDFNYSFESDIQNKTHFADDSFDLTFALDVLEHLNDPELALTEILRITKPNGYIFISVPTESNILKFFRMVYNKIIPIETQPHWKGKITSEKEFFKLLNSKKIKIVFKKKFPFNFLPKIFSYDIFYFIQKTG